jgi:hypothetical protein
MIEETMKQTSKAFLGEIGILLDQGSLFPAFEKVTHLEIREVRFQLSLIQPRS